MRHQAWRLGVWILVLVGAGSLVLAGGGAVLSDNAALRAVFETGAGLLAVFTGGLFFARFRDGGLLPDLGYAYGLALTGVSALVLALVVAARPQYAPEVAAVGFMGTTVGLGIIAVSAISAPRQELPLRRGKWRIAAIVLASVLGLSIGAELVQGNLAAVVASAEPVSWVNIGTVPWLLLAIQVPVIVLLVVAVRRALHRVTAERDELLGWVAVALTAFALARVHALVHPPTGRLLYLGDLFYLGAHGILMYAAVRAMLAHWRGLARSAVFEERQRVARNLHDGIAQELALLSSQSRWLARRSSDGETLELVATVAQRALDESRRTISALRRPMDEPLVVALRRTALATAAATGRSIDLGVEVDLDVAPDMHEELLRFVREGISCLALRPGAGDLSLQLTHGAEGLCLQLAVDGETAVLEEGSAWGLAVTGLSRRADAMGGRLDVVKAPGGRPSLALRWPDR